jgi:hypothetical protein
MTLVRPRRRRVVTGVALGIALSLPAAGPAQTPSPGPATIGWRHDLPRALAEARALDRLVWVQFTGPWCHNCLRMERESFNHPSVLGQAAAEFVAVKLRSDVHEELAVGYGLSALPATVILRPTGTVVATTQGFLDPGSLAAFLRDALAREGRPTTARDDTRLESTAAQAPAERTPSLQGYCPVSLVENHRLVPGRRSLTVVHRGEVYRVAGESERGRFRSQPERYVPVNGGRCPVSQVDRGVFRAGSPRTGVLYEGHLYLCGDESDRQRFLQHPERYAHVDAADRGFCPHCWAHDDLLVRGRPEFSLTRGGRRYLFPDLSHLEAYRSTLDTAHR